MDFYHHYNRLYAAKDYGAEAAVVLGLLNQSAGAPCRQLLEVGCGTGNHSRAFAAQGVSVVAVDIDARMIAQAVSVTPDAEIRFVEGHVEQVEATAFQGAAAMFNVVNYVTERPALLSMFRAVADRLTPASSFVFDCWNGVAALTDPPRNEVRDFMSDGWAYQVTMTADSDRMRQLVHVSNIFEAEGPDGRRERFSNDLHHRLWTPAELTDLLVEAGFITVRFLRWMEPEYAAGDQDWKIMAVAEKGMK